MTRAVQRDVTARGVRLRVVEEGDGPRVVLLHGLFVDHRIWDGVRGALRDRFRVIAPDFPGFGQSEKPPPSRFAYGIDAFAAAVADLYAGLELGRAALVGHGLGAAVALTVAALHPEFVSRLVLIGAHAYTDATAIESRLAHARLVGNLVFKQLVGRTLFRTYFRERLLSQNATVDVGRIDAFYDAFNSPAARGSALATLRAAVDTRPVIARTSRIQAPTLVVWGRSDAVYAPTYAHRLAREIRGAGLELVDSGHVVPEECPNELARLLRRFLEPAPARA
ncbi:MAG TPA: alpha/beta fold hydrolase [Polyangiaceae bacterium]|nr:alpha/beta fold hydrolase [Polyangiaceae bacterium]